MTISTGKPEIYISSTVYDFRDLRSALKYDLEQLGYAVHLSETNDFPKPVDANSYKPGFPRWPTVWTTPTGKCASYTRPAEKSIENQAHRVLKRSKHD